MFSFEADKAIIMAQQEAIEAALTTDPKAEKMLRKIIRDHVIRARAQIVGNIPFKHGDPREARKAVRTTVYKQVLGANLNILNSRKAHGVNSYEPPRTLQPGQRGGNRRKRSDKTQRIMSYAGWDRGFVLRWVNKGATRGNRGKINGNGFFMRLGTSALNRMEKSLAETMAKDMAELMEQKKK